MSALCTSTGILSIFTDCNRIFSDGVFPLGTSVAASVFLGGEMTLLEAETKIPMINNAFTNNSAKHALALLEDSQCQDDPVFVPEPIVVCSL